MNTPTEVLIAIIDYLQVPDILNCRLISRQWERAAADNCIWIPRSPCPRPYRGSVFDYYLNILADNTPVYVCSQSLDPYSYETIRITTSTHMRAIAQTIYDVRSNEVQFPAELQYFVGSEYMIRAGFSEEQVNFLDYQLPNRVDLIDSFDGERLVEATRLYLEDHFRSSDSDSTFSLTEIKKVSMRKLFAST